MAGDQIEDGRDVGGGGLGVEQGEPQVLAVAHLGAGHHGVTGGEQCLAGVEVGAVDREGGADRGGDVAEDERGELRFGHDVEAGVGGEHAPALRGRVADLVEEVADGVRAHHAQRHPQLQGVEAPGGYGGLAGLAGEAPAHPVADQDGRGTHRLEEGLVVVHGDGVGALDAVEEVPVPAGGEQPAAVRRVHVQPDGVPRAQLGDLGQRVDGAEVGGARGGDDRHGGAVVAAAALQLTGEGHGLHALVPVGGDHHHGVLAEAEQPGGLPDAHVTGLGDEDAQAGGVLLLGLLAGEQQGVEVGLGAAAGEHPVGGRAEAEALAGPVDEAALDELPPADWSRVPSEELTAETTASARTAGMTTGQLRWARWRGWWKGIASRRYSSSSSSSAASVVQGRVQVDGLDAAGEFTGGDAGGRAGCGGESGGHPLDSFGHGAAVPLRGGVIEQVRAHGLSSRGAT